MCTDACAEMAGDKKLARHLVVKVHSPSLLVGELEREDKLHYFDTKEGGGDGDGDDLDLSHR